MLKKESSEHNPKWRIWVSQNPILFFSEKLFLMFLSFPSLKRTGVVISLGGYFHNNNDATSQVATRQSRHDPLGLIVAL